MDKELKNNVDFIDQLVDKKTGFNIPENYFNGIEEKVSSSLFLDSLSKENSFKTPSDYFETIEDNIFSNLNLNEEKKDVKVISIRKRVLKLIPLTAAASLLLFITLNYFNTNTSITFDEITSTDIEYWYENGYGDNDNDELAIVFNSSSLEDDSLSSINDDNLEEYLNDIDNTDFINEIQ